MYVLKEGEYLEDYLNNNLSIKTIDKNGEPLMSELLLLSTVTYNPEDFTPIPQEDMRVINEVTKLYEKI
jgi:hypothetical protein